MPRFSNIVWDFNGTLLDDLHIVVDTINELLERRDLQRRDDTFHRRYFAFPVATYYELIGFNLEAEDFEQVSHEYHNGYFRRFPFARLHQGAAELLADVVGSGARNFALSAMEEHALIESLASLGIKDFFSGVYGLSDHRAHSKLQRGQDMIAEHGLEPADTVFIGDTSHDMDVALATGMTPVGISIGHQSPERFDTERVQVVNDFVELRNLLEVARQA